ncbi:hypothetical protein LBW52_22490 [Ralstonia solanacearum]|nr:hypothetical protein [Ralstonia solanacearum]MDB0568775.1 hypothetical protein [Ralstonia solanacearum]
MIPQSLASSDVFLSLNDEQQLAFEQRLQFCREILENAELFVIKQDASRNGPLDDVELDGYSFLSSGKDAKSVSPYLLHSSWTSDCDRSTMAAATCSTFSELFRRPMPNTNSTAAHVVEWFRYWAIALRDVMDSFEKSPTYDFAVAQCISIDALVAVALAVLATLRMNPSVGEN